MKYKVDKYKIFSKKRKQEVEILMFPKRKYMWVFDTHSKDLGFMIDGNKEAYMDLEIAYAILAQDPSKIIFFSTKYCDGGEQCYSDSINLVMIRPEMQFRRSEWFELKNKLDHKHWTGSYTFNYDMKKMNDYWEKLDQQWLAAQWEKRAGKMYLEEILGDTAFIVIPRYLCYSTHYHVSTGMREIDIDSNKYSWCWIGRILNDEAIAELSAVS